jgi:hypothetical protein
MINFAHSDIVQQINKLYWENLVPNEWLLSQLKTYLNSFK